MVALFLLVMLRHSYKRALYFLHVFQQVGYKTNEYWQWLREHWEEKVIIKEVVFMNLVLFAVVVLSYFYGYSLTSTVIGLVLFVYGIFWFSSVKKFVHKKVKKPLVFTARVKRLLVPYFVLSFFFPLQFTIVSFTGQLLFIGSRAGNFEPGLLGIDTLYLVFGWVFGNMLIPFCLFIAAYINKPIEKSVQEGFKKQARAKLASMPHLKIIAITGSYGKTSTKFMIRDLLKERFSVCSTPGSFNTPMGICKVINNDLEAHHQILILEMGARYEGNIQELCDIARPDVSVITNVGLAHLETFGSQDVIAREKGTLVRNLQGGVAILNADDERVSAMKEYENDFSTIEVGITRGDIIGTDLVYGVKGTSFKVDFGNDQVEDFQTRLLGAHNVQNLLLAIGVAQHFGLRPTTMALAATSIEPVEHRLELKNRNGIFIIDDAFNSNPTGAKNAVEILSKFNSGKRVIITPGMIELGEKEAEENKEFGRVIGAGNLDLIVLVGPERSIPIKEGIEEIENQSEKVHVVNSLFEANELVFSQASEGDVVLYENDLPDVFNE